MLCLAAAAAAAPLDNDSIKTAVAAWLSDSAAAEVTYGHITSWDTSQVTDMSSLFCAHHSLSSCNTAALSFNEDIGTWDTSGVTSMYAMFGSNEGFNRDLSDWAVDSVTDMSYMFSYARSFNQDLGWCVDDGANLDYAFSSTCPVPLTVRGTQALVSFAPLAFKLFCAARQNAVLRRSPFPSP